MTDDAFAALADCLERERAALLDGDFGALERIEPEKAALLAGVTGPWPEPIVTATRRNQALLAAAAEGVRAGAMRLSELRQVSTGHVTYSADGRRASGAVPRAVTRRV